MAGSAGIGARGGVSKTVGAALGLAGAAVGLVGAGGILAKTNATILANQSGGPPQDYYNTNNLNVFPSDLPIINGETFCIVFSFYQYDRPSILAGPTLNPLGSIALAIPNDLLDMSEASYSEQGSGLMFGAALESFAANKPGSISSLFNDAGMSVLKGGVAGVAQSGSNLINAIGGKLGTGQDASSLANKTYQMAGLAQNPFLSVLFNAPAFKRHIFSWTFIPESAQDQITLKYIINKFRYHSLPDIDSSPGGFLLTYPDMCIPKIIPTGFMYDFKQAVIEGISVNFAPGDTPVFQAGTNAPAAIKLTIKLLEIEYWIKSDILATQSKNTIDGFQYTS